MADFRDNRDSVARRVMARSSGAGPVGERGIGDGRLDRWKGGGGYYYEITDEGIKVTGSADSKTLQGKSIVLPWEGKDPKNLAMIDAILQERGERHTELGVEAEPTPPAPKPEEASQEMQTGDAREMAGLSPTAEQTQARLAPKPDVEGAEVIEPTEREMSGDKEAYDWVRYGTSDPPPTFEEVWGSESAETPASADTMLPAEGPARLRAMAQLGVDESIVPYEQRRMDVVRRAMRADAPEAAGFVGPVEEPAGFVGPVEEPGESPDVIYRPPESESRGGFEIPNEELEQLSDEELAALGFKTGTPTKQYDAAREANKFKAR